MKKHGRHYGSTLAHEFAHASYLDDAFKPIIKNVYKHHYIGDKTKGMEGKASPDYREYLERDGLYPRIFEIRRELNLKPGQIIDPKERPDLLRRIMETKGFKDINNFYDTDAILHMLNHLADTGKSNTKNIG